MRVFPCGGIAQLGERLHGMQEVIGSIPFTSTTELADSLAFVVIDADVVIVFVVRSTEVRRVSPHRLEA